MRLQEVAPLQRELEQREGDCHQWSVYVAELTRKHQAQVDDLEKEVTLGLEKHLRLEKLNLDLTKTNEALQQTILELRQASQGDHQTDPPLQHPNQNSLAMGEPAGLAIGMLDPHAHDDSAQVLVEPGVNPNPMVVDAPPDQASVMHGPSASTGIAQAPAAPAPEVAPTPMEIDESINPAKEMHGPSTSDDTAQVADSSRPPWSCPRLPDAPSVAHTPMPSFEWKQQLHSTSNLVTYKDYQDKDWYPPNVLFQGEGLNKAAQMIPTFRTAVAVVHCGDPHPQSCGSLRVTPKMPFDAPSRNLTPEISLQQAKDGGLSNLSEQMRMLKERTVVEIPLEIIVYNANVGKYYINGQDDSPLSLLEKRRICNSEDLNPLNMEQRAKVAASVAKQIIVLLLAFRYSIDSKPLHESLRFIGSAVSNKKQAASLAGGPQLVLLAQAIGTTASSGPCAITDTRPG
jgi:hypothetical protein